MNIFVGNLCRSINNDELRQLFETHGEVFQAKVIIDHYSNESKGFGFVEMPQQDQAQRAIQELGAFEYKGRPLKVNEARPRENNNRQQNRRRY